jgi:photosystem II stability/assembly factor-like uncharacterized protein
LPKAARVLADRVDPQRFYAQDIATGTLFASRDGGLHFNAIGGAFGDAVKQHYQAPHRPTNAVVYAVPGQAGELMAISARGGVIHGRDDGRVLRQSHGIDSAVSLGFGKAAPGHAEATLFLAGAIDGQRGLFRSIDGGAHWQRINDDAHQYGEVGYVTGDPRVFGRVYFATGGRGIFRGDPTGEQP